MRMDLEACRAAAELARIRARNARGRQDLARAAEYARLAEAITWLLSARETSDGGSLASWRLECALIERFTGVRPRTRAEAERLKQEHGQAASAPAKPQLRTGHDHG
jgi:hypothetical protein